MPLGFAGLSVATLVLAAFNLGWIPASEQHQVALVLIGFAFPLQFISVAFGFLARDAVVASGIGIQSGGWLAIGLLLYTGRPGSTSQTLAFLLFMAAATLGSAVLVSSMTKLVPAFVMAGTVVRWALTGVYEHTASKTWEHAAGWEGLALAILALYAVIALDAESIDKKTVLPVLRLRSGRAALTAGPEELATRVEHEPGVRPQL